MEFAEMLSQTLLPIIRDYIRPGSTVCSDLSKAYNTLSDEGYEHLTVNHSLNFVDPETGAHTQKVERMWKDAKDRNKRQCGTHRSMMDSYLCEYVWRRRNKEEYAFEKILDNPKRHPRQWGIAP